MGGKIILRAKSLIRHILYPATAVPDWNSIPCSEIDLISSCAGFFEGVCREGSPA